MSRLDHQGSGGPPDGPAGRKLRLDKANGKLAGVCAGLADYFGANPMVMRLIFVLGTLLGAGTFLVIYILIWLLVD